MFDSKATINNKEIRVTTFKNEQLHHIAPGKSSRLKIMKIFYRQSSTAAMLRAALNFLVLLYLFFGRETRSSLLGGDYHMT